MIKKMKKIILTLAVALLATFSSFAQKSNDGWFLSVGAGASASLEGYSSGSFEYGVTPAFSANFGKWIGKSVAVKVGYDGLSLKNDKYFADGVDYGYANAAIMWNVCNAFGNYKENRCFNIVPYIHGGAILSNNTAYAAGLGIQFPIRFGFVSIVPDIKASAAQDKFYSDINTGWNGIVSASLGLQLNF